MRNPAPNAWVTFKRPLTMSFKIDWLSSGCSALILITSCKIQVQINYNQGKERLGHQQNMDNTWIKKHASFQVSLACDSMTILEEILNSSNKISYAKSLEVHYFTGECWSTLQNNRLLWLETRWLSLVDNLICPKCSTETPCS